MKLSYKKPWRHQNLDVLVITAEENDVIPATYGGRSILIHEGGLLLQRSCFDGRGAPYKFYLPKPGTTLTLFCDIYSSTRIIEEYQALVFKINMSTLTGQVGDIHA